MLKMEKIPGMNNMMPQENNDPKESKEGQTYLTISKVIKQFSIPLVEKLKSRIETGAYDVLVSDEGRGRIPTLLLRKIFKKVNEQKNIETFFVSTGRAEIDSDAIGNFVKRNNLKDKRVLFVTEYISTGESIQRLIEEFKKQGIENFDVAALGINRSFERTNEGRNQFETLQNSLSLARGQLFYGKVEELIGADLNRISGTEKVIEREGWREKIIGAHPRLQKPLLNKEKFTKAREDVTVMADEIVKQVWNSGE